MNAQELQKLPTKDLEKIIVAHEKKTKDIARFGRIIATKFGENIGRQLLEAHVISSPETQTADESNHYTVKDFYGFKLEYDVINKYQSELTITYKSTSVFYAGYNANYAVDKACFYPNPYINKLLPLVNKGEKTMIKEFSQYLKEKKAKELDAAKRKDLMNRAKQFGLISSG